MLKTMGCQVSVGERSTSANANKDSSIRDHSDVTTDGERKLLTELEVDCLRSTWSLISQNRMTNGHQVFREVFRLDPKIKTAFAFR